MKKEIKGENVTNKNLVTIKIKQRKEPITGLYVNHDNNWVAVLENTYDYVLDGYTFINREWIDHFHIETDRIADYIFSNSKYFLPLYLIKIKRNSLRYGNTKLINFGLEK